LKKELLNSHIINELQDTVRTKSGLWEFDYYCRQTYLDNIMRGGYPTVFSSNGKQAVFTFIRASMATLKEIIINFKSSRHIFPGQRELP